MKKYVCCILSALLIAMSGLVFAADGPAGEAAEPLDLFTQFRMSKLQLKVDENFEAYGEGRNLTAAGFTFVTEVTSADIIREEDGNHGAKIEATDQGDAIATLSLPECTGLVIVEMDIKIEQALEYAQLISLNGPDEVSGTESEAAIISLGGTSMNYVTGASSWQMPAQQWIHLALAIDAEKDIANFYMGNELAAAKLPLMRAVSSIKTLKFLNRSPGNVFYVDNIRIGAKQNASLTDGEIQEAPDTRPIEVYPPELTNLSEETIEAQREAGSKLIQDVKNAIARGDKEMRVAPGVYRIGKGTNESLTVANARDFSLIGGDVDIIQESRATIMSVVNCTNTTIKGFRLDADPVPFTQGEVLSVMPETRQFDFKVDNGYTVPEASWAGSRVLFFEPDRPEYIPSHWNDSASVVEYLGNKVVRITMADQMIFTDFLNFRPGCRIVIPLRNGGSSLDVTNCSNCLIEDVDCYTSAGGFSVSESGGLGGNTYENMRLILRPNTNRLHASAADGFHSIQCENGPILSNCEISYAQDDLVNIHGFMDVVYDVIDETSFYIMTQSNILDVNPGTEIKFFDIESMQQLGTAKAVSVTQVTDPRYRQNGVKIPDELYAETNIPMRSLDGQVYKVTVDQPINIRPFDLAVTHDKGAKNSVIRNCYFHDGFVRGILFRSEDGIIEDNKFERIFGPGVFINAERYWVEGPFPDGVIVRNNTFNKCAISPSTFEGIAGAITIGTMPDGGSNTIFDAVHYNNLLIENNTITNSGACGIMAINLADSIFRNNTITNAWSTPFGQYERAGAGLKLDGQIYGSIFLDQAKNIRLENNTISGAPEWAPDVRCGENVE